MIKKFGSALEKAEDGAISPDLRSKAAALATQLIQAQSDATATREKSLKARYGSEEKEEKKGTPAASGGADDEGDYVVVTDADKEAAAKALLD